MVETPNTEGHLRSPWLEPATRGSESLLKLRVTDQDGHALDLFDMSSRPLALTFLYTRCTNPNRCPLVATQMGRLQKLIEAEGLDGRMSLAIVTYDPEYDTPEILKAYGRDRGLCFTPNVRMLRPESQQKDAFFDRLRVAVNYNAEGVNLHGLQLFLFDSQGRFVRRYQSVIWDNAQVLADLKLLAEENPTHRTTRHKDAAP
jgi:cytochrome oxidase Cu insertion factor (SCO1/SenC/PrrC family)